MPEPLFYFFSLLTLIFGVGVVINRNPVASALCLVASFIGLAAIYVSLNAYFLGTIQVLVYAGAVMVLFLFIIMLMDIKAEERRKFNLVAVGGGMTKAGADALRPLGAVAVPVIQAPMSVEEAIGLGAAPIEAAAERIGELLLIGMAAARPTG